jgi:hypothetical protein
VQARKHDAQISAVEEVRNQETAIIHRGAREAARARAAHGVARRAQHNAREQILVDAHIGTEDRIHDQLADRLVVALRSTSGPSIVGVRMCAQRTHAHQTRCRLMLRASASSAKMPARSMSSKQTLQW